MVSSFLSTRQCGVLLGVPQLPPYAHNCFSGTATWQLSPFAALDSHCLGAPVAKVAHCSVEPILCPAFSPEWWLWGPCPPCARGFGCRCSKYLNVLLWPAPALPRKQALPPPLTMLPAAAATLASSSCGSRCMRLSNGVVAACKLHLPQQQLFSYWTVGVLSCLLSQPSLHVTVPPTPPLPHTHPATVVPESHCLPRNSC